MSRKRVMLRSSVASRPSAHPKRKYTLSQLFELFHTAKKVEGNAPRTLSDYAEHFRYFQRWIDDEDSTLEIDPYDIGVSVFRAYIAHMSESLSPRTINIRITTLKTMFAFLADEGILSDNPMQRIRKVKEAESEIEAFSESQVDALLSQPDQRTYYGFRDYVLMTLLLDTGMRISETLDLETSDIEFEYRQIKVRSTTAKTRKSRIVPITKHTAKLLRELITESERHFDVDLVFVSVEGERLSYRSAYDRIHGYGVDAGIEEARVSPHTFRHTFAKMFILSGGDPFTLQNILGHKSLYMVRKYIRLNTEDMRIQHGQHSPIVSMFERRTRRKR